MNVKDYLLWRGDLPFKVSEFNEVDNLLLSILSYVNLKGIVPEGKTKISLKEASDRFFIEFAKNSRGNPDGFMDYTPGVMKMMAESVRFKGLLLHNEKTVFNKGETCQFSALVIDLDPRTSYISYRGTDDTLVGWKEDLEITYRITNAQILAKEYLEENAVGIFHRYYVGGHSKGGNLALYAASKCNEKTKKKLVKIYSNDGPGLSREIFNQQEYDFIQDRYIKIVPHFDIFGSIYDSSDSKIIVKSNESGIMQHSAISWQVEGDHFIRMKRFDDISWEFMKQFGEALEHISLEEYEVFTNELYNALNEAGISKVDEITDNVQNFAKVLRKLLQMDSIAKGVSGKLLKAVLEVINKEVGKKISRKIPLRRKKDV